MNAATGFSILGADARPAVVELVKLYDQTPDAQAHVRYALGGMGPSTRAAIPLMLREAASTNILVCSDAIETLGKIHTEPSVVVPELMRYSGATDVFARHNATEALGNFGTNARPAIPALLSLLTDPSRYVRDAATNALNKINPEAAARAGVK